MAETVLTHNRFAEGLRPDRAALVLIDCQERLVEQAGQGGHALRANLVALARLSHAFELPVVLGVLRPERFGPLVPELSAALGEPAAAVRAEGCFWDDFPSRSAVRSTGRRDLIVAGLTPETGVGEAALAAQADGYAVQAVVDASAGGDPTAQRIAAARMSAAGIGLTSWVAVMAGLAAAGGEIGAADAAALAASLACYEAGAVCWGGDGLDVLAGLSAAPLWSG